MTVRLFLIGLVLLPLAAEAQRPTRRIVSRPWPSTPAARPSDAFADSVGVDPEPTDPFDRAPAPPPAPAAATVAPPSASQSVYGRTGLRVSLPSGWVQSAIDESRLPTYALYTFSGPLRGVTLRVEQVVGLNPLEEQQWRVGQTAVGYDGTRPIGTIAVPLDALAAFETAGPDTGGAVAFLQRGRTFWSVSVQAPAPIWRTRKADLVALMQSVTFASVPAVRAVGR